MVCEVRVLRVGRPEGRPTGKDHLLSERPLYTLEFCVRRLGFRQTQFSTQQIQQFKTCNSDFIVYEGSLLTCRFQVRSKVKRSKTRTQRSQTRAKRKVNQESAEGETAEGVKKAAAEAEKKEAAGETEQVCCEEEAPYWLEVSADCPPEWETVLRHQMLNQMF